MYCKKCGAKIEEESKYCENCGEEVIKIEEESEKVNKDSSIKKVAKEVGKVAATAVGGVALDFSSKAAKKVLNDSKVVDKMSDKEGKEAVKFLKNKGIIDKSFVEKGIEGVAKVISTFTKK